MDANKVDVLAVTPRQIADHLQAGGMGCNCDLDNWQPEVRTGHSHVCRIHRSALGAKPELLAEVSAALAACGGAK